MWRSHLNGKESQKYARWLAGCKAGSNAATPSYRQPGDALDLEGIIAESSSFGRAIRVHPLIALRYD